MKNLSLLLSVSAVIFLLSSCGHSGEGLAEDDGKLDYAPEVNEVEIVTLRMQDFPMQLLANGKLSATQKSALYFKQSGIIRKINAINGANVTAGQVIAELESEAQQAALTSAEIELDRATLELQDVLVGLGYPVNEQNNVPENIMKTASVRSGYSAAKNNYDQARRALEETVIKAPFSGRVADITLKQWEMSDSKPFCTILGDREFDVNFTVLESEYAFIEKGQPVKVSPFADGSVSVDGRIVSVNPSVANNGQIQVMARIPGARKIIDGMNVKVVVSKTISRQLVVPKSAVVIRDGLEVVFRYNDKGKADWVYVNTLQSNSESYAIIANAERFAEIHEGDKIIVSGNLNLADGSDVVLKK